MAFWRTFGFQVSEIETLLDKGDCEIEDLLDKGELLVEECKGQNKKLVEFIAQTPVLSKLIGYTVGYPVKEPEPPMEGSADGSVDDFEELKRKRANYPHFASEVLCHEDWTISEAIAENEELLELLWSFLDVEPPLNPLIAICASKVASIIFQRKVQEIFGFLKKKEGVVVQLVKHIGSGPVSELLMKMIQVDKLESQDHVQWLEEQNLIKLILNNFGDERSSSARENIATIILDILSSPSPLVPLVASLESEEHLETLFSSIITRPSHSSLYWGLEIVIGLLRCPSIACEMDTPPEALPASVRISASHLSSFVKILHEMTSPDIPTSFGSVVPLGSHRLKVVEFFAALVRCSNRWVDREFVEKGALAMSLDLFFKYHWNNFLHATVTNMLILLLEDRDPEIVGTCFLDEAGLLDRICEASQGNEEDLEKKDVSRGYMGFLNSVSNKIAELSSRHEEVNRVTSNHEEWKSYTENALSKQNLAFSVVLGGGKPDDSQNAPDDELGGGPGGDLTNICTQHTIKVGFSNVFDSGFGYDNEEEKEEPDLGFLVLSKVFDQISKEPYDTHDSDDDDF
eukprot:CAMPEP_0201491996 /NCGR_PEP_ID=MMETSP0151_2-20130828/32010_1 /ASSEMBLY_ACC=CAM_ASM_000257 /TAXON_ID=200890 /ORGANISM="Paramoeba atlantica, Strain 621/1 / CCAP 1560/9" /LENGTH=571 /DNA_ID=CAMNT_0047878637 /DNA_START=87 /DNA_END=1802 /DNA_ORIENTATION=+